MVDDDNLGNGPAPAHYFLTVESFRCCEKRTCSFFMTESLKVIFIFGRLVWMSLTGRMGCDDKHDYVNQCVGGYAPFFGEVGLLLGYRCGLKLGEDR